MTVEHNAQNAGMAQFGSENAEAFPASRPGPTVMVGRRTELVTATITETSRLSPHRRDTVVVRPPTGPGAAPSRPQR